MTVQSILDATEGMLYLLVPDVLCVPELLDAVRQRATAWKIVHYTL